jgi:parvulin-like peptidyl-prolyl isomerase
VNPPRDDGRASRAGGWLPSALLSAVVVFAAAILSTEGNAADDPPPAAESTVVAATVDGTTISRADVERSLREAYGRREIEPDLRPYYEAQALETIVRQWLVERRLVRDKLAAPAERVQRELARLRLAAEGKYASFEEYLAAVGHDEASLRRLLAWRIGWQRWLAQNVTDETRQAYFESHRAEFDGTQIEVAHVLLDVRDDEPGKSLAARLEEARQLRERIVAGELAFDEAARQYSTGPSRADGGKLGFIARRGDMSEEFARAAFALAAGDVSPPVVSRFGVHLIHCLDVRLGTKPWTEVRDELEPRVLQDVFERVATEERRDAVVEYTGTAPYLDPETGELRLGGTP